MKLIWKKRKNSWKNRSCNNYELMDVNQDENRQFPSHRPIYIYRNNIYICSVKELESAKQICELMENG